MGQKQKTMKGRFNLTAKDIIGKVTEEKKIRVKLIEEGNVVMPEIFISIQANEFTKEVADEILNALDKRVYKNLSVKTRLDEYSRNFYKELNKDTDILVMLPKENKGFKNEIKIEEVVDKKIEEKSTEELIEATEKAAEQIPVSEKEEAQAGSDSKKIVVDNTVINTEAPTSNPTTNVNTTNANTKPVNTGNNASRPKRGGRA